MNLLAAITIVLAFFLTGCSSTRVTPMGYSIQGVTDVKKVENAITRAAAERGWTSKNLSPELMELTLNNRSHMVMVDVKYDVSSYEISYKDSYNMKYNPSNQSIHKKYFKWVQNLKRGIDKNLSYP